MPVEEFKSGVELRRIQLQRADSNVVTILHLSDLHFTEQTKIEGQSREDFLVTFEETLGSLQEKFDLVVVTGDLINNPTSWRFKHLKVLNLAKTYLLGLCKAVGIGRPRDQLIVIPGNHDVRLYGLNLLWRRNSAIQQFNSVFKDYIGDRIYPDLRLLLVCLDSNVVSRRWDLARGSVASAEFLRIQNLINKLPDDDKQFVRMALIHHHPLPIASAERLRPQGSIEKFLGRPIGSPEDMVLRNSGIFLHRMLKYNFRMILHGHLHARGYWRIHNTTYDGCERWLEAISGGAMGPSPNFSFNIVKIFPDGFIASVHHGFDDALAPTAPDEVSTAPYDVVRLSSYERTEQIQSLHCSLHMKIWEVDAAHCGLITREVISSLKSTEDKEQKELTLYTGMAEDTGLTCARVTAIRKDARDVTVSSKLMKAVNGTPLVQHTLLLDPPVTPKCNVTLAIQRYSDGVIFRSAEDKSNMGVGGASATECVSVKIRWPTDRLFVRLKFKSKSPPVDSGTEGLPNEVELVVRGPDGSVRKREKDSHNVILDYHTPSTIALLGGDRSSEAVLTVYRPRLGYTYELKWNIPQSEPIPHKGNLDRLRLQLLHVPKTPTGRRSADEFAAACVKLFEHVVNGRKHVVDDKLRAYVHAFNLDSKRRTLKCVGCSGALDDPLATEFDYGMDVVGTAFRRAEVWGYAKRETTLNEGVLRFKKFPHEVIRSCLSCPLSSPENGWPIGVLTFASERDDGDLSAYASDRGQATKLSAAVSKLWADTLPIILLNSGELPT